MKSAVAGVSGLAAVILLLPMEAGIPVPLPADLVMFTVGERVGAGQFPLWLAVAAFEIIAIAGTAALFAACRGPAHRLIEQHGPRVGLTRARVGRAADFAEKRGRIGLAVGRATPGLRTLTVIAAGVSGVRGRRALPALIIGSSVFLQLHLVLGLLLGPLAVKVFNQAKGPALAALAVLAAAMAVFWLAKRRRRATWTEAVCPACIGLRLLAEHAPALAGLTGDDPVARTAPKGPAADPVKDPVSDTGDRPA